MLGLYFSRHGHERCDDFTPILIEAYNQLKEKEENFEIVLISLDDEDEDFKEAFKTMPWLALPFEDETRQKLKRFIQVSKIPMLVIIGQDGKISNLNAVELIKARGIDAYPFTPEKLEEPVETPNEKLESETMESPSVCCGEKDIVEEKKQASVTVSCGCNNSKNDEEAKEEKEG